MILEVDLDRTTYLNELLRKNISALDNITFCLTSPNDPDKTDDYTAIRTRILRELHRLKAIEKLNMKGDTESREKT